MIDGIQPKTVAELGPIVAEALGLDWTDDRREVVDYINRGREDLYLMYPEFKLFTNKFYCLELSCFPNECLSVCSCSSHYMGVTIPDDIDGILAVWEDHEPLRMYSKWWEARVGRVSEGYPQTYMSTTLVHEEFPTQRALQKPSELKFYANHRDDDEKELIIVVDTVFEKRKEFHVKLAGDGVTTIPELVNHIHSIVLPCDLKGEVTLSQDDGYILSEYCGYETIPSYRRLKVNVPCNSGKILLHGNQKFKPIYFDSDIVEIGSRRIWETIARFYRYGENSTDTEQLRKADMEEQRLRKLLRGALDRKRGNSDQDPSQFTRKRRSLIKSTPLSGYKNYGGFRNHRRYINKALRYY